METSYLKRHIARRRAERQQYVTVFSDASHCPRTLAAGWAVWMKHGTPAQTERLSGALRDVTDSHKAEVFALEQALDHIEASVDVTGKIVVIESDCKGALRQIEERANRLAERGARFVKMKWVKGHQGVKCARSSVNTWCDREAKRNMRSLRDNIIKLSGVADTLYSPKAPAY